jgi:hypothetical protein
MAITTRSGKGSTLTHGELDTNFTELDTRLVTIEAVDFNNLDARVVVLENEDDALDLRLDALEALNLDLRITSNENRLDAYDVLDLHNRVETLELQTLDARLTVVEDFDLDTRVTTNAGDITSLDSRVTLIEADGFEPVLDISSQVTNDGVSTNITLDPTTNKKYTITMPDNGSISFDGWANPTNGQKVVIYIDNSADLDAISYFARTPADTHITAQNTLRDYSVWEIIYDGSMYWMYDISNK